MELSGLQYVFERLSQIVSQNAHRAAKEEQRNYAVTSLRRALNETEIYYGTRRATKERDRDKEVELSHMWSEAAGQLSAIDEELSNRCKTKGRYWADPVGWPEESAIDYRITTEDMHSALDTLLK